MSEEEKPKPKIRIAKLKEFSALDNNPNLHNERGLGMLNESIQEDGFVAPMTAAADKHVLDGNARLEESPKALGAEEALVVEHDGTRPVIMVRTDIDDSNSDKARRIALRANRIAQVDLNWNMDVLKIEFEKGNLDGMFDEDELLKLGLMDEDMLPEPKEDRRAEIQAKWGTKVGQRWHLGSHILAIDSSLDLKVAREFEGIATLTFTSPPYWVGKDYETQKSKAEIDQFIKDSANVMATVTKKDCSRIVINTGTGMTTKYEPRKKRNVLLLIDKWANELYALGWDLRHVRHWIKAGQVISAPKTDIIDQYCEFLGTFENDDGGMLRWNDDISDDIGILETFYNVKGQGRGQMRAGNWALAGYWDDIHGTRSAEGHTAAFPPLLVFRHLLLYSQRGEWVFDPFLGSGTTMVACELLKRKCVGIELDPGYAEVTLERWQEMTGGKPELVGRNGQVSQ